MEKTLEEKIRRAEEIYARRNGYASRNVATVNVSKGKKFSLYKKMIIQIGICLTIYFVFYLVQNSNYVFSQDVINKTKEILSYDIDINGMWSQFVEGINKFGSGIISSDLQNKANSNTIEDLNNVAENAIGGAEPQNLIMENTMLSELYENNRRTTKRCK